MQKEVRISVRLPVEIRSEDGRVVTSCFLLDTPQAGSSKPDALAALGDAVRSFLISCFGNGNVDRLLHDHELCPQDAPGGIDGRFIEVSLILRAPAPNG